MNCTENICKFPEALFMTSKFHTIRLISIVDCICTKIRISNGFQDIADTVTSSIGFLMLLSTKVPSATLKVHGIRRILRI